MTKRVPIAVAFPVILLGGHATVMVVAALASLFLASLAVGVALAAIGAVMVAPR